MSRLGHEQLHVGIRDVAGEVLAAPGVVEPDDACADETCAADRDHVVGVLSRSTPTWGGLSVPQPGPEHRREPDARFVVLGVGEDRGRRT